MHAADILENAVHSPMWTFRFASHADWSFACISSCARKKMSACTQDRRTVPSPVGMLLLVIADSDRGCGCGACATGKNVPGGAAVSASLSAWRGVTERESRRTWSGSLLRLFDEVFRVQVTRSFGHRLGPWRPIFIDRVRQSSKVSQTQAR